MLGSAILGVLLTIVGYPKMKKKYYPLSMRQAPLLPDLKVSVPKKKYALLITPFYPKDPHASFGKHVLTPSLTLAAVAGATPPDWETMYWDENLLQGPPPYNPFPFIVGITVHLTFAKRAFELADWYRQRGAKVVLGGLHVTSCPDECIPHADALAIGEGTQVWPLILADAAQSKLQSRYEGDYAKPYNKEPAPRHEIFPRQDYLTTTCLVATRGCHNRCEFCYLSTAGIHMPYRVKDVTQIVTEFRSNNQPYGVFIDNNLGSRKEYLHKLCSALKPIEKIWSAAVSIDITDDPGLVREMALAGCTGVFVGFETLNEENLREAHKKTPSPDDYARRVEIFHRNGIQVNASFVFGFDHDHPDVFKITVDWIEQNRLECATFHILTPYPGTPLFQKLDQEGRILHQNWELYDTSHVVFNPRHMSPEELLDGYHWSYQKLFSLRSIWRRRPGRWSEVPGYLAMSYLYKRGNYFWPLLIRRRLTHTMWRPLIERARKRHLRYRRQLDQRST